MVPSTSESPFLPPSANLLLAIYYGQLASGQLATRWWSQKASPGPCLAVLTWGNLMLALPMAPAQKLCASLETKAAQVLTAWNGVCRCLAPVWGLLQQLKSCPVKNLTTSGGKKMRVNFRRKSRDCVVGIKQSLLTRLAEGTSLCYPQIAQPQTSRILQDLCEAGCQPAHPHAPWDHQQMCSKKLYGNSRPQGQKPPVSVPGK